MCVGDLYDVGEVSGDAADVVGGVEEQRLVELPARALAAQLDVAPRLLVQLVPRLHYLLASARQREHLLVAFPVTPVKEVKLNLKKKENMTDF